MDSDADQAAQCHWKQKEASMQACINDLSAETKCLTEENTRLKLQLKRISGGTDVSEMGSLEELKKGKTHAEATVRELQVRLDSLQSTVNSLESDLATVTERNEKLAKENQDYLAESVEYRNASNELTTERDMLKSKCETLQSKMTALESAADAQKQFTAKTQLELDHISVESAEAIAKLREEKLRLEDDNNSLQKKLGSATERFKMAVADMEQEEDGKAEELERIKNKAASLQEKLSVAESLLRSHEKTAADNTAAVEKIAGEKAELLSVLEKMKSEQAEAEEESASSIKKLTEARNLAEAEVVQLKTHLNAIHPLFNAEEKGVKDTVMFSFTAFVEMKQELDVTKARLKQIQETYKEVVSKQKAFSERTEEERRRAEHLASQLVEVEYQSSRMKEALRWRDENQLAIQQATEVLKTNDILSTQLQYLLHDLSATEHAGDSQLTIEFKDIAELQQKNIAMATQLAVNKETYEKNIAGVSEKLEKKFGEELEQIRTEVSRLQEEKQNLEQKLVASTENCRRLVDTLEQCTRYNRILNKPNELNDFSGRRLETPVKRKRQEPGSAPPGSASALVQTPASGGLLTNVHDHQIGADDLAAANDEINTLKYQTLDLQRTIGTIEASKQHIQSLYESSMNEIKHLTIERDHYKQQAEIAEKGSDEMLTMLLESQNQLKEQKIQTFSREAELETLQAELKRLRTTNKNLTMSQDRIDDVLSQMSGVQSFIVKQRASLESDLRSQRDEARKALSEEKQALQEERTNLRKQKQELTDVSAVLATTREQLASATKMLEDEKEQHKQQIERNKKLAADLDRSESERRILKQTESVDAADYLTPDSENTIKDLHRELELEKAKVIAAEQTNKSLKQAVENLETSTRSAEEKRKSDEVELVTLREKLVSLEKEEVARKTKWEEQRALIDAREAAVKDAETQQKERMEDLENKNRALQKELNDGEQGRHDAAARCEKAEHEAEEMRRKYEDAVITKGELTTKLQELKGKIQSTEQGPPVPSPGFPAESELQQELQHLREDLDKAHAVLSSLEPAHEIRESDLAAVVDVTRCRNKELEHRVRLLVGEHKAQVDQLRRQTAISSVHIMQSGHISKLERRIQNLKGREAELEEELAVTTSQRDELKGAGLEAKSLKEQVANQQANLKNIESKHKVVVEQLHLSITKARSAAEEREQEFTTLKQKLTTTEGSLKVRETTISKIEELLKQKEEQSRQKDEQFKQCKEECTAKIQAYKKKYEQILKEKTTSLQATIDTLKSQEAAKQAVQLKPQTPQQADITPPGQAGLIQQGIKRTLPSDDSLKKLRRIAPAPDAEAESTAEAHTPSAQDNPPASANPFDGGAARPQSETENPFLHKW